MNVQAVKNIRKCLLRFLEYSEKALNKLNGKSYPNLKIKARIS
jgi:hypothetical protein